MLKGRSDITDQMGREIFCKCRASLIVCLYMLKSPMKFVYRHIQGPHILKCRQSALKVKAIS